MLSLIASFGPAFPLPWSSVDDTIPDAVRTSEERAFDRFFSRVSGNISPTDWAREQRSEPMCYATMTFLALGCPSILTDDLSGNLPLRQPPSFSDIRDLAAKGCSSTGDDDTKLLVPELTPPSRPGQSGVRVATLLGSQLPRIYVPAPSLLWMMHNCHVLASCHLRRARTLHMVERVPGGSVWSRVHDGSYDGIACGAMFVNLLVVPFDRLLLRFRHQMARSRLQ